MKPKNKLSLFGLVASLAIASAVSSKAADTNEAPVAIRTVQPVVPWAFERGGSSEVVLVTFTVDEKGTVQNPVITKATHEELRRPVLAAISKWRFKPAHKNGTAVATLVTVPIKFGNDESSGSTAWHL